MNPKSAWRRTIFVNDGSGDLKEVIETHLMPLGSKPNHESATILVGHEGEWERASVAQRALYYEIRPQLDGEVHALLLCRAASDTGINRRLSLNIPVRFGGDYVFVGLDITADGVEIPFYMTRDGTVRHLMGVELPRLPPTPKF